MYERETASQSAKKLSMIALVGLKEAGGGSESLVAPLTSNLLESPTRMSQNTVTLTDGSWETDVLKSDVPVLVDFWAEWCGPCRMVGPTVDAIAEEFKGKLKVGKLNIDDNGDIAMRYQVRGIPMFLLFKDGQIVEQKVGAMGKSDFLKMIEKHVSAAV